MSNLCRFCGKELTTDFADLGLSPISNEYLSAENSRKGQMFYPLHARVCSDCFLVQADAYSSPEKIFNDYKYLSSNSQMWLKHAEEYVDMITDSMLCRTWTFLDISTFLLLFPRPSEYRLIR